WASLPIVATQGDSLSRLVTTHGLGLTVPAEDVDALAEAIRRLREDKDLYASCQSSVEALAPEMTWEKALAPIMDFCRRPHRAPDKAGRPATYVRGGTAGLGRSARYYARRFFAYYRSAGAKTALTHARNFTRARLGR
ncbi:MAG TPA: hypothetical protein VML96_08365, partial [Egibacteraceae bacterium]|nr:hypothetical protein [Egibacteraceae bacterium]